MELDKKVSAGRQFGKLTVLEFAGRDGNYNHTWRCQCECGTEKIFIGTNLLSGNTRSCGCGHRNAVTKHGHFKDGKQTPERTSWRAMMRRCTDESYDGYKNYGGRGISVCERWQSFIAFLEDMGLKPSREYTLERRENNGNYEPSNCYWATRKEQAANRRPKTATSRQDITYSM